MVRFKRRDTAEDVSAGVDLTGRNALVTGANTGIGRETARVLALRGARVTLACRDANKARAARGAILNGAGGAINADQLDLLELDLNSLAATRGAAEHFCALGRPLHLLINNAGIMIPVERRTQDGFEAHLGINHLAHFLFTHLLLDALRAAGGARVVAVSSGAMAAATLTAELADLNWERRKYSGLRAYGDSKLMNLMFAREFTRRYQAEGIVSNALHPGVVPTELARDQSWPFMLLGILMLPRVKSLGQGASASVLLATHPDYAGRGGLYIVNNREKRPAHKLALNDGACAALWERSERLTGLQGATPDIRMD